MGFVSHEAIIVTANDSDTKRAHRKAKSLGLRCTSVAVSEWNDYSSFLVIPDGSKEGLLCASDAAEKRELFMDWLDRQEYEDGSTPFEYVEVHYTNDDGRCYAEAKRTSCVEPATHWF